MYRIPLRSSTPSRTLSRPDKVSRDPINSDLGCNRGTGFFVLARLAFFTGCRGVAGISLPRTPGYRCVRGDSGRNPGVSAPESGAVTGAVTGAVAAAVAAIVAAAVIAAVASAVTLAFLASLRL